MMLKRIIYIPALAMLLTISSAKAFFPIVCPPIDGCPMMDPLDEIASTFESITDLGTQVQSFGNQVINDVNNLSSSLLPSFAGDIKLDYSSLRGKKGESQNSGIDASEETVGQRPLSNCVYLGTEYLNTSSEDVFDLVQLLFMKYPSNSVLEIQKYDGYRDNFYTDSLWEIYTAVRELETEMKDVATPNLEAILGCIKGETDCETDGGATVSADASNDAAFIVGKAYQAVDIVYELLLKITALKAQYTAVKAIKEIRPLPYEKLEEQASANISNDIILASSSVSRQDNWSFASVTPDSTSGDDFDFVVAPDSPEEHEYVSEAEQLEELHKIAPFEEKVTSAKEVHNLINGLDAYKNAAISVNDARNRYIQAKNTLDLSIKCTRKYVCSYFDNPSDSECEEICMGEDGKSGVIGWTNEYYQAAKAAETSESEVDSVPAMNVDQEENMPGDSYNPSKGDGLIEGEKDDAEKNQDTGKKQSEEARRAQLIGWRIGAEISKELAANASKWGANPKDRKDLLWEDEKSFYYQYISLKYDNIKEYLKAFTTADVLNVVADRLIDGKNTYLSETSYQQYRLELYAKLEEELAKLAVSLDDAEGEFVCDKRGGIKLKYLITSRDNIAQELEALNASLKANLDELSALRDKVQDDAGQSLRDKVNFVEPFPENIFSPIPESEPIEGVESAQTRMDQFSKKSRSNKEESGIAELEAIIKKQKAKVAELSVSLSVVEENINACKEDLATSTNNSMRSLNSQKSNLVNNMINKLSKKEVEATKLAKERLLLLIETVLLATPIPNVTAIIAYETIENIASAALNDAYSQMKDIVDNAKASILNMGDELYDPKKHSKIVEIHQQMIKDLSAISIDVSGGVLVPVNNIIVFAKIIASDTEPETVDYFVGNPARSRDIKAPMKMFQQSLPNVREIFHFDSTDFQNVKPFFTGRRENKSTPIRAKDLLKYGGDVPFVWTKMLRDYAYVETAMPFEPVLSRGCELETFYRGGAMPCKVEGTNKDKEKVAFIVDMNKDRKFVTQGPVPADFAKDLSNCTGLKLNKKGKKVVHAALDKKVNTGGLSANQPCNYSELGIFLKYETDDNDNQFLKFRDEVYDAYYLLWQNEIGKLKKGKQKRNIPYIEYAPFSRNQIGDYLSCKENEQKLNEQKVEAEASYAKKLKELVDKMVDYGYQLPEGTKPENLDMADSNVFDSIRSSLLDIKNELIAKAFEERSKIVISEDYETVKERVETLEKVLARLIQDSKAWVNIGDDVGSEADLEARIKSAIANEIASQKYESDNAKKLSDDGEDDEEDDEDEDNKDDDDDEDEPIGFAKGDGYVYDLNDKLIGKILSDGFVVDEYGITIGKIGDLPKGSPKIGFVYRIKTLEQWGTEDVDYWPYCSNYY